jgi:hypothetical protein
MAVRSSAIGSMSCDIATTTWLKLMPRPVIVVEPMTMPATAHATATAIVFLAPSSSASVTLRHEMPARVVLRMSAIGRHAMAATSAQSGAL